MVISVEFEQDISNCVSKSDPFLIEMQQKGYQLLNISLIVIFSHCYKSYYQWSLHPSFIQQLLFSSSLFKLIENQGARNRTEDEHVQKDVKDKH